jgi:hypothetical protein
MDGIGREKRRYKRFTVDLLEINGKMILANEVEILDISLGGLSVKADRRLDIGNVYTLKIEDKTRTISLNGTVIWSLLSDVRTSPEGERVLIYTGGMRFADMSDEKVAELTRFIEGNRQDFCKHNEVHELSGLRLNIRFSINAPGKVVLERSECYRVKKIGLGGMLIESSHEMEVENRFPMEVSLPDKTLITFHGRVASCLALEGPTDKSFDVGIEFADMPERAAEKLREFIAMLPGMGKDS